MQRKNWMLWCSLECLQFCTAIDSDCSQQVTYLMKENICKLPCKLEDSPEVNLTIKARDDSWYIKTWYLWLSSLLLTLWLNIRVSHSYILGILWESCGCTGCQLPIKVCVRVPSPAVRAGVLVLGLEYPCFIVLRDFNSMPRRREGSGVHRLHSSYMFLHAARNRLNLVLPHN